MTSASPHLRWPAERFYWALLEAPGWVRPGPIADGLREPLADEVPGEVELHAACAPLGDGTVLACAAVVTEVEPLRAEALSLTPEDLPEFARGRCDPSTLNLLTGPFEPLPVRAARRRAHALAAGTVAACALLAAFGLMRRAEAWRADEQAARDAAVVAIAAAAPDGDLLAERDRLLREAQRAAAQRHANDAAADLASVLDGWPARASCQVQSIGVNAEGASVAVTLREDPGAFLGALSPPDGWALDEPRLNAGAGGETRVSVRIRPLREVAP